jgi:type II secretory pathway component PulC
MLMHTLLLAAFLPAAPGDAIVKRNIFCSGCDAISARPARLDVELVSILFAPGASAAVLVTPAERSVGLYRTGERVGGAELVDIQRRRVTLRSGDRIARLDLDAAPPARSEPHTAPQQVSQVRCSGRSCDIDPSLIASLTQDPTPLGRWVRALPAKEGGLALAWIRPGSPIAQLGLESGDRLAAVNGQELGGIDNMLRLYGNLKSATRLSLTVDRGGTRITYDYKLR